jgi:hypothetical protein
MEAPSIQIQKLQTALDSVSTVEALDLLYNAFPGKVTFSSSFSFEDQVITHQIIDHHFPSAFLHWIPAACLQKPILYGTVPIPVIIHTSKLIILIRQAGSICAAKGP